MQLWVNTDAGRVEEEEVERLNQVRIISSGIEKAKAFCYLGSSFQLAACGHSRNDYSKVSVMCNLRYP